MDHVLTDVCSSRAHRLPSFLFLSSKARKGTLLDAALHRPRAAATARDGGRSLLAMELAARASTLVHRGAHMEQMAGLQRVSCSIPAIIRVFQLVLGEPSVGAAGTTIVHTVRARRVVFSAIV